MMSQRIRQSVKLSEHLTWLFYVATPRYVSASRPGSASTCRQQSASSPSLLSTSADLFERRLLEHCYLLSFINVAIHQHADAKQHCVFISATPSQSDRTLSDALERMIMSEHAGSLPHLKNTSS